MEDRKSKGTEDPNESGSSTESQKIIFKNSTKLKSNASEEQLDKKSTQGSSKLVMAEYVVGGKKESSKKRKLDSKEKDSGAKQQLKLSHLDEEEDE